MVYNRHMKRIGVYLADRQLERLRALSKETGITVSEQLRNAVSAYLWAMESVDAVLKKDGACLPHQTICTPRQGTDRNAVFGLGPVPTGMDEDFQRRMANADNGGDGWRWVGGRREPQTGDPSPPESTIG